MEETPPDGQFIFTNEKQRELALSVYIVPSVFLSSLCGRYLSESWQPQELSTIMVPIILYMKKWTKRAAITAQGYPVAAWIQSSLSAPTEAVCTH